MSSLPTPDSPSTSTVASEPSRRTSIAKSRRIAGEAPAMPRYESPGNVSPSLSDSESASSASVVPPTVTRLPSASVIFSTRWPR